jgi:branched-chain amino acid transport system permease protein
MEWDLLINALVSGLMLGGFYTAVAVGVTIAFGMLDIVNIAHPAFIVLGAFVVYILNTKLGIDPLLASALIAPVAYMLGRVLYRLYYVLFERTGEEALQGLAFFFGILFMVEVSLLMVFGVDYRFVDAPYIDSSFSFGLVLIQMRFLISLVLGLAMVTAMYVFLNCSYIGLAILAVSQNPGALRLVGGNPTRVKEIGFGLSIATAVIAGALLIIIQPVEPSLGREYIGRAFAICVLGGMTSLAGTVVAAMILGLVESVTMTFVGPSWAPAIAFGLLTLTLVVRPAGIFGR